MQEMHGSPTPGSAHERHFVPVIRGRSAQHPAQQLALRFRHGRSFPQATHHDGRTIRSASRPTNDNALASVRTRTFYEGSSTLKNQKPSRIVPAMKRTLFLLALVLAGALPALAQESTKFGFIVGGSRRFVDGAPHQNENDFIESNFSFSNTSIELFWSIPIEPDLNLKFKGGRIDTQIAIPYDVATPTAENPNAITVNRRDVEGEVQHIEGVVEYEFDEPFGSSGLFAGLGYYRQAAPGEESRTNWGVVAGVNADFPITKRYGVVLEGSYHWTHEEFEPRFMTVGGGFRVSF